MKDPDLRDELHYPDPGHHYLEYWWSDERLRIRLHMMDTTEQMRAAIRSLGGKRYVVSDGFCQRKMQRETKSRRVWACIDVFLSREVVAKTRSVIWHELQHVVDQAGAVNALPKLYYARTQRMMPRDERRACLMAGLVEATLRWADRDYGRREGKASWKMEADFMSMLVGRKTQNKRRG